MSWFCKLAGRTAAQGPEHPVREPPQPRRHEPIDDPPEHPDDEPPPPPPEDEPPQPPTPLGPAPRRPAARHGRRDRCLMQRAMKGVGVVALSLVLAGCWMRPDDPTITSGVINALQHEPNLAGFGVAVVTVDGCVTLSGVVTSEQQARRVVEIAQSVTGVSTVKNQLTVKTDRPSQVKWMT